MSSVGRYDILPGSNRCIADLGVDGASVRDNSDGGKHVTIWNGREDGPERYSYDVDRSGNYIPGTLHYTDNMADVLRKMGHTRW